MDSAQFAEMLKTMKEVMGVMVMVQGVKEEDREDLGGKGSI